MASRVESRRPPPRRIEPQRSYVRERISVPVGLHSEIVDLLRLEGHWMDFNDFAREALREKVARLHRVVNNPPTEAGGTPP
jgi:hypothetical protein